MLPRGCLLLLAGADTQDNRVEVGVWGYGRGGEMWTIDHQIFFGNPAQQQVWDDVAEFLLQAEYPHEAGPAARIYATAIDSGGTHPNAVQDRKRCVEGKGVDGSVKLGGRRIIKKKI